MNIAGRALIILLAVAAACGCHPVTSVAGRTAQVLPEGEIDMIMGGGLWQYDGENREADTTDEFTAGYFTWAVTRGVGGNVDVRAGVNNTQFFADVRYQLAPRSSSAFVSLELGVSAWLSLSTVALPMREVHYGLLVSQGGVVSRARPYAAVRMHNGRRRYYTSADTIAEESSTQLAYFAGVEIALEGDYKFKKVLVEYFQTLPGSASSSAQLIHEQQAGINILLAGYEF